MYSNQEYEQETFIRAHKELVLHRYVKRFPEPAARAVLERMAQTYAENMWEHQQVTFDDIYNDALGG